MNQQTGSDSQINADSVFMGQETFCPTTYCPRTYIVPGQYVAFEVCFEGGRGCL